MVGGGNQLTSPPADHLKCGILHRVSSPGQLDQVFACVAQRQIVDDDVPSALINLYSSGIAAIGSLALAFVTGGFNPLGSSADLFWIIGMGGFGGTAVLFLIMSYRMTEQSNLAPFSYFGIPLAFVLGWVFYGEAPWSDLFPGAFFIIVGGLLIVWREGQNRATKAKVTA